MTGPLPEARVYQPNVNHGWVPFILPFVEQQNLYDTYRLDLWSADGLNQKLMAHQLEIFQCGSAPEQDRYYTAKPFSPLPGGKRAACDDYAPTWSINPTLARPGLVVPAAEGWGVLAPEQMTRLAQVTDGTSNTILLTEKEGFACLRVRKTTSFSWVLVTHTVTATVISGVNPSTPADRAVPGRSTDR